MIDLIEARIYELAAYLRAGLREIPKVTTVTSSSPELSGGLTTFYIDGVPSAVTRETLQERFGIYAAGSGFSPGALRISTHIFVSKGDLDRLLEGVKYVTANAATLTTVAR